MVEVPMACVRYAMNVQDYLAITLILALIVYLKVLRSVKNVVR